jgi:hypothetical protein
MPELTVVRELVSGYEAALGWAGAASLAMLVGSLALLGFFITRTPADYFARPDSPPSPWANLHPALHIAIRVARNIAGLILVLAGIAMLVLPGQGLLTILMGIMLLQFPGKRRLELALVRRPPIFAGLNWIRTRAHREPFEVYQD